MKFLEAYVTAQPGDRFRFTYPSEPQFNRDLFVTYVTGYAPDDLVFFDDGSHSKQKNVGAAEKLPTGKGTPEAPLLVVAGLHLHPISGKALLAKRTGWKDSRTRAKRPDLWETPGGKVDGDEPIEAALKREWKEELNLDISVGEFIASASFDLEVAFTVHLYEVMFPIETCRQIKHPDHTDMGWFDFEDAVQHLPCSPAFYKHYPMLRRWLLRRAPTHTPHAPAQNP